jgi:hypothetical protein
MTSLAQWRLLYMRDTPTRPAPPYITVPTSQRVSGFQRLISAVTAAAAAKPATLWPDGKDRYPSLPFGKPRMSCQSSGLGSSRLMYGRARPNTPFMPMPSTSPINSASVPCRPRSASLCDFAIRPAPYMPMPMTNAPGTAMVLTMRDDF